MADNTIQPDSPDGTKTGSKPRKVKKETKASLRHALKLELMRTCKIYGKTYEDSKAYFKIRGLKLELPKEPGKKFKGLSDYES